LKVLRSYRGGEYSSNDFKAFCQQQGIIIHNTTRYTPRDNVVEERENKSIMNMAKCMLREKKLSNDYWAKAVLIKVYVLNKYPTTSLQDVVPQEAWNGKR